MSDYEYVNVRRISYGNGSSFVPVCEKCFRFVTADKTIPANREGDLKLDQPNANCKRCGRTNMLFEGYCGEFEARETTP